MTYLLDIDFALFELGRGHVVDGAPAEVESRLLAEQSEIQNRLIAESRDDGGL